MSRALIDEIVLRYIDAKLMVDGHITTKDINGIFDISRQKSSNLFTIYKDAAPKNMVHDLKQKKYIVQTGFLPAYLGEQDPSLYIESLKVVFAPPPNKGA